MLNTNLTVAYNCQQYSGANCSLFPTMESAEKQRAIWVKEAYERFEKNGTGGESILNSDCDGKAHNSFVIAEWALPGGIDTHKPGELLESSWEDNEGFKAIKWGNIVLERP